MFLDLKLYNIIATNLTKFILKGQNKNFMN